MTSQFRAALRQALIACLRPICRKQVSLLKAAPGDPARTRPFFTCPRNSGHSYFSPAYHTGSGSSVKGLPAKRDVAEDGSGQSPGYPVPGPSSSDFIKQYRTIKRKGIRYGAIQPEYQRGGKSPADYLIGIHDQRGEGRCFGARPLVLR